MDAIAAGARWARANLFNGLFNSLLTLAALYLVLRGLAGLIDWAFIDAVWSAPDGRACRAAGEGACWAFIGQWYRFILFGRYPYEEQWRPMLVVMVFLVLLLASCDRRLWTRGRRLALLWVAGLAVNLVLMGGGILGLAPVETGLWNGLPLTLLLAIIGLVGAFPLAILLALGRRSTLPAIRALAVGYIEIIRGVPLITVLFMASVMVPLFLPSGVDIDKLLRAQIGLVLFFAAYLAEVVRGGLQSIPRGQYEAADALGLAYWRKMGKVILPQALSIAIPPLVNTLIAAFKDTTLVTIIGLFDLISAAANAITDPNWRGFYIEAYAFVGAIYFAFCFFMSRYSRHLEAELNRGRRGRA